MNVESVTFVVEQRGGYLVLGAGRDAVLALHLPRLIVTSRDDPSVPNFGCRAGEL
jgi:hypothetical protein